MINSKVTIFRIFIVSLIISGCELIGPDLHEKIALEKIDEQAENVEKTEVIYQELSNDGSFSKEDANARIELYPGTGRFVSTKVERQAKKSAEKGAYSLNFDDADLGEVAKVILSDILHENYVLSPKVSGKVTLQTSQPLRKSELLPTLDMLLDINNAAMVYQGGLYQIKSKADALGSSAFTTYRKYRNKMPAGYQIIMVPIKNVAVEELAKIIKPLMQDKTILNVDSKRNMMMIAGADGELLRAMDLVEAFDTDVMKGRSFGLFPLKSVGPATMIEELEQVFSEDTTDSKGLYQFLEIDRLNAILVITHQAKFLKQVERWVLRLDRANTSAGGGVNVYRVQHMDAVELATTLNEIFSSSGNKNKPASIAPGRRTVEVTNKQKKKSVLPSNTRKTTTTSSIADIGEVKIIADEINNALIIVATAQDYAVVSRVIKQLDVMPLQVLIDATIVEVTLTDSLAYGIKWFLSHENGGDNAASSGGSLFTDAAATAAGVASGGFGYAFLSKSSDIRAVLEASATDDKLNIISSPSLMVLNNHEASIQVGDEVPIRTSESTNTNASINPIQTSSIQQRKTGVKLKIKPRVNANGLVIMDIEQSVENVAEKSVAGSNIDSPTISTREITSSVAVQSGETIVLGGLIKEDDKYNKKGIPALHNLPLIGFLFGSTDKSKVKTELVVLITPRVVKSRQDARLITDEFKRKLSGIYEEPLVEELEEVEE